jgi:hypothetical protein
MPIRIQRQRKAGWKKPEGALYVGRPTLWGNPFPRDNEGVAMECLPMKLDGSDPHDRAAAATDLYRRWLTGGKVNELIALYLPIVKLKPPKLARIQRELRGKNLMCWCAIGEPCHADVLIEIANRPRCEEVS